MAPRPGPERRQRGSAAEKRTPRERLRSKSHCSPPDLTRWGCSHCLRGQQLSRPERLPPIQRATAEIRRHRVSGRLVPAEAFSVKPGGSVEQLVVKGDLVTHGPNVTTYAVEGGKVGAIDIKGKVIANGKNSNAVLVANKGSTPLTNVHASAAAGKTLVLEDGTVADRTGFSG